MANKCEFGHNSNMKKTHFLPITYTILCSIFLTSCFQAKDYGKVQEIISSMATSTQKQNPDIPVTHAKNVTDAFVIVDVRSDEEINISMIKGAMSKKNFEENILNYKDREILVYCTVGTRATQYAKQLREKSYRASNLYGGVLAWAWENREFTKENEKTTKVHVLSKAFDLLPETYQGVFP